MAAKYWVGGSGNWSDNTNHWSDTSGGSAGADAPGSGDDCIFDANSFTLLLGDTVSVDTTVTIQSMDWSAATLSPALNITSGGVHVTGNVTLKSTMTLESNSFDFSTPAGSTSIFNPDDSTTNASSGAWNLFDSAAAATSTVKLAGDLNVQNGNFVIGGGIFDTDGYAMDLRNLVIGADDTVYLRNSTIILRASSAGGLNVSANATLDAGTSTFQIITNGCQLTSLGGHTYNRFEFLGGTAANSTDFLDQGWTINYLYVAPAGVGSTRGVGFEPSATTSTIVTLEAIGTATQPIEFSYLQPGSAGTYALCVTNAIVDYVDVEYMDASCGNPVANPNGTDSGNNTNILFGEGAVWFEGIPGAHYKKPQMEDVNVPIGQLKGIDTLKPQASIVNERRPILA